MQSIKPDLIDSIFLIKKNSTNIDKKIFRQFDREPLNQRSNLSNTKKNIWIEAYGCSANIADSELIAGILKNSGYNIVNDIQDSDLNIIVTCSVKDSTEHKIIHRIDTLTKYNKSLIVAGCLPKTERKKIEEINPTASLLGPNTIDKIVELADLAISNKKGVLLEDSNSEKVNLPKIRLNQTISIIEIASGCLSQCSFCQTKIAKGWLKSYRPRSIIQQINEDIKDGCKEIWLTSTDNGCYGKDINSNLVELLESSIKLPGNYKIRLGMLNPMYLPDIIDDLVKLYRNSEKLFKFLHIPVQSGSDKILRRMNRGHNVDIFKKTVCEFRKKIPEITLSTDIIVGFPDESDEDFDLTIDLISDTEPDIVNISKYSSRSGTISSKYKQLNSNTIKSRSAILHNHSRSISKKRNSLWKNWNGDIYIDEINDGVVQGRNYAYKSIIIKDTTEFDLKIGDIAKVVVYDYSEYSLFAKTLSIFK